MLMLYYGLGLVGVVDIDWFMEMSVRLRAWV